MPNPPLAKVELHCGPVGARDLPQGGRSFPSPNVPLRLDYLGSLGGVKFIPEGDTCESSFITLGGNGIGSVVRSHVRGFAIQGMCLEAEFFSGRSWVSGYYGQEGGISKSLFDPSSSLPHITKAPSPENSHFQCSFQELPRSYVKSAVAFNPIYSTPKAPCSVGVCPKRARPPAEVFSGVYMTNPFCFDTRI